MDKASNKAAIYMVSAWATENQLVFGQQKVDEKSNEITAIPKLTFAIKYYRSSDNHGCNGLPNGRCSSNY